jgi:hypothetical protein
MSRSFRWSEYLASCGSFSGETAPCHLFDFEEANKRRAENVWGTIVEKSPSVGNQTQGKKYDSLSLLAPRGPCRIGNHFQPIQSHIAKECRPIVLKHISTDSPRQICGETR